MKKRGFSKLTAVFAAAAVLFTGTGLAGSVFADGAPSEEGSGEPVYIVEPDTELLTFFKEEPEEPEHTSARFSEQDGKAVVSWDGGEPIEAAEPVVLSGSYTYAVFSDVTLTVILDGAHIANENTPASAEGDFAAVSVVDGADVTFELRGANAVQGGRGSAGLYVELGSSATLTSKDGTGSLSAVGGDEDAKNGGAGIGGNRDCEVGTVTIESGTITAQGGVQAAGIGSGFDGSPNGVTEQTGTIRITGGRVKAIGGSKAAGIGSGDNGYGDSPYSPGTSTNVGTVTIEGGSVYAAGHTGIGGGNHKNGGTVRISGNAEVECYGSDKGGAAIGSGQGSTKDKMVGPDGGLTRINGGEITVAGNARVRAIGGEDTAGIGGGLYGDGGKIRIAGSADVYAVGGCRGAGIGGGYQGDSYEIGISGDAVVRAFGGTGKSKKDSETGGAGIGGGALGGTVDHDYTRGGNPGVITIDGSVDVLAVGGWGASGIGSGSEIRQEGSGNFPDIRHEKGSITIGGDAVVSAFSDGTKWAVDLVYADVDASGLAENSAMLQGRFRANPTEAELPYYKDQEKMVIDHTILDWAGEQPYGAYPVMQGESFRPSTNRVVMADENYNVLADSAFSMPVNYRSFARTGFTSGKEYDVRLTSETYPAEKLISGVAVDGSRQAGDASAVTDAGQRLTAYHSEGIGSNDDLAFTIEQAKEPQEPLPPVDPDPPTDPDKPQPPVEPEKPQPPVEPERPTEPVEPEPPVEPVQPDRPVITNPVRPTFVPPITEPTPAEETIPEEEVPLAQLPEQAEDATDTLTIIDGDVPLGKLPTTGYAAARTNGVFYMLAAVSAALACFFCFRRRKHEEPEG